MKSQSWRCRPFATSAINFTLLTFSESNARIATTILQAKTVTVRGNDLFSRGRWKKLIADFWLKKSSVRHVYTAAAQIQAKTKLKRFYCCAEDSGLFKLLCTSRQGKDTEIAERKQEQDHAALEVKHKEALKDSVQEYKNTKKITGSNLWY